MYAVNLCALRTVGCLRADGCADRYSDGHTDREPDRNVPSHYAEHRAQRGPQSDAKSRVFGLIRHKRLLQFRFR